MTLPFRTKARPHKAHNPRDIQPIKIGIIVLKSAEPVH
jgi:hypothetical protein